MSNTLQRASRASSRELLAMAAATLLASRILQAPPGRGLALEAGNLLAELDELDPEGNVLDLAVRADVRRALEDVVKTPEALEAGEVAYAQLFYGVGENPVPLVESVYTSDEHVLYDRAYLAVREAYAEAGFELDGTFEQPGDDLCVELAFASFLLAGAAGGDPGCLEALVRFCREHLDAWAPTAVADLQAAAGHPLYRAVANLVAGLLAV